MDMFFTENKILARIQELEPYRYLNRTSIGTWKAKEDPTKAEKYPPPVDDNWKEFTPGTHWEGRDHYLWLQTNLTVPHWRDKEELVLLFDFGKTGGGHNSGFESMLYINGAPDQGVDSNHKEAFLDPSYSGQTVNLALKLWSGLEGGGPKQIMRHHFIYADHAILSPEADNLYYTSKTILDTIEILGHDTHDRASLLNVLNRTFELIDWADPGSDDFYASIANANDFITKTVSAFSKTSPITVTAIGHTHIDVAWLWRLKHTREKIARSFATALKLMERYPEYIFLQSQPQLYAYIKEDYPEIYEKIKAKITAGKWEVDGAMWVEADCNISSGESLVRQILHGRKFIKEEFNQEINYLWLPDVFGYSWALPQILKKSGINTFMTTKISWSQYNRMPHDTFTWRGIDGSEVLTHFITTPDMGIDSRYFAYYTYNGLMEPKTVKGIYDNYRNKDINSEMLLSYGYGDGGGGVNRDMLESRRRLNDMPSLPTVKTGKAKDYFEKLHTTVKQTQNYVHTWDGELYLEYHRGTYTSQAFVKKWNRKLELAYRDMEILHSWGLVATENWEYPTAKIHQGWETILLNQFHDIIPGTSINEVYQDCEIDYQAAFDSAENIKDNFATNFIDKADNKWTIFNTAGWKRDELIDLPVFENGYFTDNDGVLESVKTEVGYKIKLVNIAPLSSKVITFVAADEPVHGAESFVLGSQQIETPFYRIAWNASGQLIEIFDRENEQQVLAADGLGNYLRLFEDKPMQFDAWDIDLYYKQKSKTLAATSIEVDAGDGFSASVVFSFAFGSSKVVQEMVVYRDSRRIDFKTKVDWRERQQLLQAGFDVNIRATEARYHIQYGSVKRPTHWNTSWDMARFESVAHQWVDFSERDYGVALLNDCKYGHHVKDNTMAISLLKGPIYPDPEADLGHHEFTYSLLPHSGDFVAGNVVEHAWSLNNPVKAFAGDAGDQAFFKIDSKYPVAIEAIKRAEAGAGLILRLHDHTGSKRKITLSPIFKFAGWCETNLMEAPIHDMIENTTGDIKLELTPFEVKTIWIR